MFEAEFVCTCGFTFKERFLETEVFLAADLENFYVRCPRCGEEASPRSFQLAPGKQPRRLDWS
jgi:phage terminase large subunit GpA-like protein